MKKLLILMGLFFIGACRSEAGLPLEVADDLPEIRRLNAVPDAPVRQIAASKDGLYLLDLTGRLWQTNQQARQAHLLQGGFSPLVMMQADDALGVPNAEQGKRRNQLALAYQADGLTSWAVWRNGADAVYGDGQAAWHGQAVWLLGCLIALEQGAQAVFPVRLCPQQNKLGVLARAENVAVLPDNRPVLWENKVVFLGEPDEHTYPHGVLGDKFEAKTLYTLDAQTLEMAMPALLLPDGLVFEHNTLTVWDDKLVAVIAGRGEGARVAVLAVQDGYWQIVAESRPLPEYRWQSPFVFAGGLYAVQMPHLHGRLVKYVVRHGRLVEQEIASGLSNHAYGARDTQIAAVLSEYVLLPKMAYRQVYAMDASGSLYRLSPTLPDQIVRSVVQDDTAYFLLTDGSVWYWQQPVGR